ncbi:MAG: type II toxin-antitoxin system HigB family toxin [Mariniphaga sp.]
MPNQEKIPMIFTKLGNIVYLCKKKVRVIAKGTLRDFWIAHRDCEGQLKSWFDEAEKSNWISPQDIKSEYPSASILQGNRIVFNIKGNSYRLVVKINYKYGIIWIRFIGTHGDYDKINTETI